MKHHIEIIARGVCVKNGKLLLCHTKGSGNTYLPGGHVEFNEKADFSLAREIAEEMGLRAKVGRFLGAVEHTFKQKGERHCEINLVFLFNVPGLSARRTPKSCEGYIEFLWARVDKLRQKKLEPAVLCKLVPLWLKASDRTPRWASSYP